MLNNVAIDILKKIYATSHKNSFLVSGKALKTLVVIARLAERLNMRSQSRTW